jgi:hypothetical protein
VSPSQKPGIVLDRTDHSIDRAIRAVTRHCRFCWACQFNLKSIGKMAHGKLILVPSLKDNIAYVGSVPIIVFTFAKDYEFSRRTMEEHWHAGYDDAVRTLSHPEVLQRPDKIDGVRTLDFRKSDQ